MVKNRKSETLAVIKHENVISQIHFIRGEKVILDVDLAALYGVEVKQKTAKHSSLSQ